MHLCSQQNRRLVEYFFSDQKFFEAVFCVLYFHEKNYHVSSLYILENPEVTSKSFAFCTKNQIPLYYVSASDGTNVVKMFNEAIEKAVTYKKNPEDIEDQIMDELERFDTN